MGLFSGKMSASASEGDGGGGGGGYGFGLLGPLVAKALAQAAGKGSEEAPGNFKSTADTATSNQTSEESPGNAINRKKGGKVTASTRADGIAQRGKTRGRMV